MRHTHTHVVEMELGRGVVLLRVAGRRAPSEKEEEWSKGSAYVE